MNGTGSCVNSRKSNETLRIVSGGLRSDAKSEKLDEMVSEVCQHSTEEQAYSLLLILLSAFANILCHEHLNKHLIKTQFRWFEHIISFYIVITVLCAFVMMAI